MTKSFLKLLSLIITFLPSIIKIPIYRHIFGYKIGRHVKIGLSWIYVDNLEVGDHVIIRHFNRLKNLTEVKIGCYSIIGMGNTFTSSPEFTHKLSSRERGNHAKLIMGDHAAITLFHYFDVQDLIFIGDYTTIAGKGSTFFTHYINVEKNLQSCKPIYIGRYCMIGSSVKFAPGAVIPDYCVVGMGSVVAKVFHDSYVILAGNPATFVRKLPEDGVIL